jgi:uncharacterized membrane protein
LSLQQPIVNKARNFKLSLKITITIQGLSVNKTEEKRHLKAVRADGRALRYIKPQTDEIALAAVINNGKALRYVVNQTPEICLEAVSESGMALEFVKNKTEEIALAAVIQNGYALEFVDNKTDKITLAAVSQVGQAIQFAENETPEIALAAVKKDGWALGFIKNETPEIALAAVTTNWTVINIVDNQTPEIIEAAWNKSGDDLLNFASERGITGTIDYLISKNVPVDHLSKNYTETPFQLAVINLHCESLIKLHDHGADIHIINFNFQRNVLADLICRTETGKYDRALKTINTLLEIGVSPLEPDSKGFSALNHAQNKPEILAVLNAFSLKKLVESTISKSSQSNTKSRQGF